MNLSRGAPPRFDERGILLLLDQIGKTEGRQDHAFPTAPRSASPEWRATSAAAKRSRLALKNLPEGFSVAANDVKAPPYIFQAYKDPVALTLTLTGYVPDNNVHAALVERGVGTKVLQRKGGRQSQGQRRRAGRISPPRWCPRSGALSRLSTGTLVVSDREVKLSGDALYDAAVAQIRAGLGKDFPQGWQFKPRFRSSPRPRRSIPPCASNCFRNCWPRARSASNPGRSVLDADSAGLLDRLIETALRCPSRQYRDRRTYRWRRRRRLQPGAVGEAGPGGDGLSGQSGPCPSNRFTATGYGSNPADRLATTPTKARRRTAASISW